ncbi:MAG: lytic transglycosylase domain-containing protein [bacterium]|nr:lytic transglycosylase domain-containing protein [bacterium]
MNSRRIFTGRALRPAVLLLLLSGGCQSLSSFDGPALTQPVPESVLAFASPATGEFTAPLVETEPVHKIQERMPGGDSSTLPDPRPLLSRILSERARHIRAAERAEMVEALAAAGEDPPLDPFLILGVIEQESRFRPNAEGPHGSLGLMQVRPFVGEGVARRIALPWRGAETLFDPSANLRIGIAYLKQVVEMYGDEELALAAYNMGPYRLRRMLQRGAFPRGTYSGKVYEHRDTFKGRYTEPVAAALR